jgi:hypothetical protein
MLEDIFARHDSVAQEYQFLDKVARRPAPGLAGLPVGE